MGSSLLTLGSYAFSGLEIPERLLLKTKQRLVVHHLLSGSCMIDAQGIEFETISFGGIFTGSDALYRVRSLERLKYGNSPIALTWDLRTFSVLIQQFDLNYSSSRWVRYHISCYVVHPGKTASESATDVADASSDVQILDVLSMLAGTGLSVTTDQSSGLEALARMDYDVAPVTSVHLVSGLLRSIDDHLSEVPLSQNAIMSTSAFRRPADQEAQSLRDLVSTASLQTMLVLARNRVSGIVATAENIGDR